MALNDKKANSSPYQPATFPSPYHRRLIAIPLASTIFRSISASSAYGQKGCVVSLSVIKTEEDSTLFEFSLLRRCSVASIVL